MATSAQKAFAARQAALKKAAAKKKTPAKKKPMSATERAAWSNRQESKADGGWGADYRRNMKNAKFTKSVPVAPTAKPRPQKPKKMVSPAKSKKITGTTDASKAVLGVPRLKKREDLINKLTKGM